jgi:hypothetical protein
MSEEQWLCCTDPILMLEFLRDSGIASERKLRLFAAACCRRIWPLLPHEKSRELVEIAEQYAEGQVPRKAMRTARKAYEASPAPRTFSAQTAWSSARQAAEEPAFRAASLAAVKAAEAVVYGDPSGTISGAAVAAAQAAQVPLLRDVVGLLPFRSLPPLSASVLNWKDGLIVQLARAAYEQRLLPSGHLDPARLAVLCDALEDAGCEPGHELLLHLRGPGPHVRGCVAVDWILGRQ